MKRSTAAEKAIQKNLELLAKHGYTIETTKEELLNAAVEHRQSSGEVAEAVITSIDRPGSFTYRVCKRCGESFGTNYKFVGFCSDHCRYIWLETVSGIKITQRRSAEERWGGEPPMIIPPSVLRVMGPYAKRIVAELERLASVERASQMQRQQEAGQNQKWEQLEFDLGNYDAPATEPSLTQIVSQSVASPPQMPATVKTFSVPDTVAFSLRK